VSGLKIVPLEQELELARDYLNERCLQVGHVLPLDEKLANEYFPVGGSCLVLQGRKPLALFLYQPRVHMAVVLARFRVVVDSKIGLKKVVEKIERTAMAQERFIVRTTGAKYAKLF
jgi:hypothetical protein